VRKILVEMKKLTMETLTKVVKVKVGRRERAKEEVAIRVVGGDC
jgi:hypothetical protein